jgi:AcrR family transcriptional regulator
VATASSVWAQRTSKTRAEIVEASIALFIEFGFELTTIEDIVRRAGVARRTFFRYFPTKEAVLFSEFKVRQRQALESLERRPLDEPAFVALVRILGEMCDSPLEPVRAEHIRQVVNSSPTLLARQRLVVVDDFGMDLVALLASRDSAYSLLELRALVASVLECNRVATVEYLHGSDRSLREIFDDAVGACRRAWTSLPG